MHDALAAVARATKYQPAIRHLAYVIAFKSCGPDHPAPGRYALAHIDRYMPAARAVFLSMTDPYSEAGRKMRLDIQSAKFDRFNSSMGFDGFTEDYPV